MEGKRASRKTFAFSLRDAGETISDGLLTAMVLNVLLANYNPFITVL